MSRDILDLIDHVVDEHDLLSADAMRWAPSAPDPTPAGEAFQVRWDNAPIDILGFIRDVTGVQLKPCVPQQMLAANPNLGHIDETRVRIWLNDILTEDPR